MGLLAFDWTFNVIGEFIKEIIKILRNKFQGSMGNGRERKLMKKKRLKFINTEGLTREEKK
mgnify:CR=1 FL=1